MDQAIVRPPLPQAATMAAMDPAVLRKCLGRFATGVTVVTYAHQGSPRGATVNSFTSVSIDPPLILVAIGKPAKAATGLEGAPFAVNVLAREQLAVAMHFAGRPQAGLAVPWDTARATPRLHGCAARLECAPWKSIDAGDHILFLGRVIHCEHADAEALLFHGGRFRSIGLELQGSQLDIQRGGQR